MGPYLVSKGRTGAREAGEESVALMLLRRTTLRQLLMRPPHSVRAWMHGVAARVHGVAARDAYRVAGSTAQGLVPVSSTHSSVSMTESDSLTSFQRA